MGKSTLLSWSSGKDSAFALYKLRESPDIEVVGLFTTVNTEHNRVSMHAVRDELLTMQAEAIGLPLIRLPLPNPCSDEEYAAVMSRFVDNAKKRDIHYMAFGDLYLEDVRSYREEKLKNTGITPLFPLWKMGTYQLASGLINRGFRLILTCVDPRLLPGSFAGREFDRTLLEDFPESVDPCGENGEFHTFVYDGPIFRKPLQVKVGEIVKRDGFIFADVLEG